MTNPTLAEAAEAVVKVSPGKIAAPTPGRGHAAELHQGA
jgi:hypothetical protein